MSTSNSFDWISFWDKKAQSSTDFQATGRGSMDILGFLHTVREISLTLQLTRDDSLLDIGCGTGIIDMALSPWVKSINGIDISDRAVNRASDNCKNIPNVKFSVGDITKLGRETGTFSKVCGYSVLQYLRDEQEVRTAFECIGSVLKSDGVAFMAANPDPAKFKDYMKIVDAQNCSTHEKELSKKIIDATLWLSPEKMIEVAEKAGLIATIQNINVEIWQSFYMYNVILKHRT